MSRLIAGAGQGEEMGDVEDPWGTGAPNQLPAPPQDRTDQFDPAGGPPLATRTTACNKTSLTCDNAPHNKERPRAPIVSSRPGLILDPTTTRMATTPVTDQ